MARDPIAKRVARAAASGGGRSYRAKAPSGWYASLAIICLVGLGLVGYSRYENFHHNAPAVAHPTISDTWYAAFGVDICGKYLPSLPPNANAATAGIRSIGRGIIEVAPGSVPSSSAFSGANATLGTFLDNYQAGGFHGADAKLVLTKSTIRYPGKGQKLWVNGDKCGSKPGRVELEVWSPAAPGFPYQGDPSSFRFQYNNATIAAAFVPAGASIPRPPSYRELLTLVGSVEQPKSTTTTAPPIPTTTAPKTASPKSTSHT